MHCRCVPRTISFRVGQTTYFIRFYLTFARLWLTVRTPNTCPFGILQFVKGNSCVRVRANFHFTGWLSLFFMLATFCSKLYAVGVTQSKKIYIIFNYIRKWKSCQCENMTSQKLACSLIQQTSCGRRKTAFLPENSFHQGFFLLRVARQLPTETEQRAIKKPYYWSIKEIWLLQQH